MFVLDTNVISELRRPERADMSVTVWAHSTPVQLTYISAITVLELEMGVLKAERTQPEHGKVLRAWLNDQVLPQFEGRILPVDKKVAKLCAAMHVPNKKSERDALIAATAKANGFRVATRNTADFIGTGVELVNPWGV